MAWIRRVGSASPLAAIGAYIAGAGWLATMWFAVLPVWYFVTVLLFGVFTIPYRLIQRGNRKQRHIQEAQLATMQTMLVQQQEAILRNQVGAEGHPEH